MQTPRKDKGDRRDVVAQTRRRLSRLAQFRAYEGEEVNLTELSFGSYQPVEGVPGLRAKAISLREEREDDVSIVLFDWEEEEGRQFGMHHHQHRELVCVASGRLEVEIEGDLRELEEGDSAWIAAGALHRMRPMTDCIFFAVFEPPLPFSSKQPQ